MERNKGILWVLLCLLLAFGKAQAQDHRFMVFFSDKNSSYSLESPQEFLSQRAIDRRSRQNITLTEQDLPVSTSYIQGLKDLNIEVRFTTKWFNGALVETDSSRLGEIQQLAYVSHIEMVAPGPLVPEWNNGRSHKKKSRLQATSSSHATDGQNHLLGIEEMHLEGIQGEDMLIAVFDGGFEGVDNIAAFAHLYDNGQLVAGFDFVGNSDNIYRYDDHGTRALSVIAAYQTGSFTGSAHKAGYLLCVTEDVSSEYRIEEYNWVFAAEMADSAGVDIINTSLGYNTFDDPDMNYTVDDLDGQTAVISQAASMAASKGMVLTVSAGNSGNSLWQKITAPADAIDVLAVGAITSDTVKASFSSFGPSADGRTKPDVVALGVSTALINSQGNVVFSNGTSFSAPQIAGLAAGFWQDNPQLNYRQVIDALKNSGSHAITPDNELGFGIPNYVRASEVVLAVTDSNLGSIVRFFPNPIEANLYLVSRQPLAHATLIMHNLAGQKILENDLMNLPADQQVPVELPYLIKGVYLVSFIANGQLGTFKLIKY